MPELTASLDEDVSSSFDLNTLPRTAKKRVKPLCGFSQQHPGAQQLPQRSFIRICHRAKRVRFFRNGDQYFKGVWYAVAADRFRCFEALLEDLNRTLGDLVNLPHGVRCVFTADGQKRVTCVDDLEDGESYVCASNDVFKKIDYENAKEPIWCYSTPKHSRLDKITVLNDPPDGAAPIEPNDFVYPKIITVIRNGVKPRRVVRLLLNKRTARSFGQVLSDVTVAVKLDTGAVRKLFTLDGKQLTILAEFFKEDDVFIACGNERMSVDDFYLDCEEYRFLYSSKYRPSSLAPRSGLTPKTPPSCRRLMSSKQQRNSSSRFINGQPNRPSPVLRRKFLNQKNQRKLKSKQQCDLNDQSAGYAASCLSVASSSFATPTYPLFIEDKFSIGRIIGDGNFAVVHECICKETKRPLALKVIDKLKCVGKEEIVDNEVQLMRRLHHSHIVELYDFWNLDDRFFVSMELIRGGDLFDSLVSVRYYSESEASQMMNNLLSALDYLHDINVAHRDVKPENLLVYESFDGRKQLKLADFGLATVAHDVLYTVCGTPTYVAPEILAETGYGIKVDIWAAGVIMYIMLCGFPPFVSMSNSQEELFELILSGEYNFPKPYWNHVSNAAKSLIQGMLQLNAEDRYSAAEVLIHPWITGEAKVDPEFEEISGFVTRDDIQQTNNDRRRSTDLDSNFEFYYSRRRSMDELSSVSRDFAADWRYCDDEDVGGFSPEPANPLTAETPPSPLNRISCKE